MGYQVRVNNCRWYLINILGVCDVIFKDDVFTLIEIDGRKEYMSMDEVENRMNESYM